ncbi:hypothetical protein E2C01_023396 [Portunus trituberculatus]|uniref:Uncharacterized protein n=1 Tax=Portunus trituberculatus TaxID=210409 RepID=A0A5B7E9V7_PORTR|nr:hypothetical protein [Portunus trituberculatus]
MNNPKTKVKLVVGNGAKPAFRNGKMLVWQGVVGRGLGSIERSSRSLPTFFLSCIFVMASVT